MFRGFATILLLIQLTCVCSNSDEQELHDQPPDSPCPEIFEYRLDTHHGLFIKTTSWFGIITTDAPPLGPEESVLTVKLVSHGHYLFGGSDGSIQLYDTIAETNKNMIEQKPIRYRVNFSYYIPIAEVEEIVYNNKTICKQQVNTSSASVISRETLIYKMDTSVPLKE